MRKDRNEGDCSEKKAALIISIVGYLERRLASFRGTCGHLLNSGTQWHILDPIESDITDI